MRSIPRSLSGRAISTPARSSSLASQFRPASSTSCVSGFTMATYPLRALRSDDAHQLLHLVGDALISSLEQSHELLNGQASVGNDAAECTGTDLLVVGNNGAGVRVFASEGHVTPALAAEHEADAFQSSPHLTARQVGGKLGHDPAFSLYAAPISTNSLPASVGTGSPASRQSWT